MDQPRQKNSADNRRDFLRESLMLAAVPAAPAGNVAQAAISVCAPKQTLSLAVLGCGRRGVQLARASLASTSAHVGLCGLADIFPDRIHQAYRTINGSFAERVSVENSQRYTGMRAAEQLAESGAQAVIVAAPPGFRLSHLRTLIEAGKHLYVERPLATSISDTLAIADLVELACDRGCVVRFGLQHRYQPFFRELVAQLHDGAIGRRIQANLSLERSFEQMPARSKRISEHDHRLRNWQHDRDLGGHPLVEQLSGQLDLINWIVGSAPATASPVAVSRTNITSNGDAYAEVRMTYSGGLEASCQLRAAKSIPGAGLSLQVHGTDGWCDVLKGKIHNASGRVIWSASGAVADSGAAIDSWISAIGQGCNRPEARSTAAVAIEANLTALLGQLALERGQTVHRSDWS
jgi:myo-inositol 2-dehydrogenase / D-chiro-inositol 1-dehydrogenase